MCSLIFYREVAVVLLTICLIYQTKMQIIITYVLRILCKARKTNALLKRNSIVLNFELFHYPT